MQKRGNRGDQSVVSLEPLLIIDAFTLILGILMHIFGNNFSVTIFGWCLYLRFFYVWFALYHRIVALPNLI